MEEEKSKDYELGFTSGTLAMMEKVIKNIFGDYYFDKLIKQAREKPPEKGGK